MIVSVDGRRVHASTGGVALADAGPVVVLIHGAGMDSTVWQLQTRYLSHRGLRAIAIDLPGHGRSEGPALGSVDAMADWVARFMDAAHIESADNERGPIERAHIECAHIVGHSMGTFVALALASRFGARVESLTLCGTATGMPVHPDLLDAAALDLPAAAALMASWSIDRPAHIGHHPTPGLWMLGGTRALVEMSRPGVLSTDFAACMSYDGALAAAAAVTCPTTVVVGLGDKMTPPKSARQLAAALHAPHMVELTGAGHMMMTEDPRSVNRAILTTVTGQRFP